MASIAIMIGGAIVNAASFIGGNFLAKYLSGDSVAAMEKERERYDHTLKAYQAAYAKYMRDRTKLLDWIAKNPQEKAHAKQNFTNTDNAFKLYNQVHPDARMTPPKEPKFSDFYQPREQQKNGELLFVGASALALGYVAFRFISTFCPFLLMDSKLTKIYYSPGGYWKGIASIKKIIRGCQGPGRNCQKMACQAGNLADISPHAAAHSSTKIQRANPQCRPPGRPSFSAS